MREIKVDFHRYSFFFKLFSRTTSKFETSDAFTIQSGQIDALKYSKASVSFRDE